MYTDYRRLKRTYTTAFEAVRALRLTSHRSVTAWLGVGVTSTTDVAVCVPPKVASQLAVNASTVPGAT
jgi:hypothetical protein